MSVLTEEPNLFTIEERADIHGRLIAHAERDPAVIAAAVTGSHATGYLDRWSDIDIVLSVDNDPADVVLRWTAWLYDELGAVHHWDLPSGSPRIIRVFLLPGCLEVDVAFCPPAEFGPRGPQWQTLFGATRQLESFPEPDLSTIAGLAWHHLLHAQAGIHRGHWWQAEHWISATRSHLITLACLRLGFPASHAKGAHMLPVEAGAPLDLTLVRALTEPELVRALRAAARTYSDELRRADPTLAERFQPLLADLLKSPEPRGQTPS